MTIRERSSKPFNTNVIQVYAPTADSSKEELENFYQTIKQALDMVKSRDNTIIMDDFNAKVGRGRFEAIVGEHGLGNRNERGDRLIQFCQDEHYIITKKIFKLTPRRLYM